MTVVVLTRDTICSDRMETIAGMKVQTTKIFHERGEALGEFVVAFSGTIDTAFAMLEWLKGSLDPSTFPARQRQEDSWCRCIILTLRGERFTVEKEPVLIRINADHRAFGAGQDYAAAALHLGCLPGEAVKVANDLCVYCGFGVEGYSLDKDGFSYWSLEP